MSRERSEGRNHRTYGDEGEIRNPLLDGSDNLILSSAQEHPAARTDAASK